MVCQPHGGKLIASRIGDGLVFHCIALVDAVSVLSEHSNTIDGGGTDQGEPGPGQRCSEPVASARSPAKYAGRGSRLADPPGPRSPSRNSPRRIPETNDAIASVVDDSILQPPAPKCAPPSRRSPEHGHPGTRIRCSTGLTGERPVRSLTIVDADEFSEPACPVTRRRSRLLGQYPWAGSGL